MAEKQAKYSAANLTVHINENTPELTATANEMQRHIPHVAPTDPFPSRSKLPTLNRTYLMREMAKVLCGAPTELSQLPESPYGNLKVVVMGDTHVLCLVNPDEKLFKVASPAVLRQLVSDYAALASEEKKNLPFKGIDAAFAMDRRSVTMIMQNIEDMASAYSIEDWKPIRLYGDDGWTITRLDFAIEPLSWQELEQKAPFTFEWLNRCDKPQVVARWLYELVTQGGNAKRQLWVWGDRDSLKSTLFATIGKFYRATFSVIDDSHFEPNYNWLGSELIGKGLILIDDCDPKVCTNRRWKAVTGSDMISVDRKFQEHSLGKRTCRFVCTSNFPPKVPIDDMAVASRLAVVKITPGHKPEGEAWGSWQREIQTEFRFLLGFGHTSEKIGDYDLQTIVDSHPLNCLLESFQADACAQTTAKQVHDYLLRHGKTDPRQHREFYLLLENTFGVKQIQKKISGKNIRVIPGLRIL